MTPGTFINLLPMTADAIVRLHVEEPDPYVANIIYAATVLGGQGRGHYRYSTSWVSSSLWVYNGESTVIPHLYTPAHVEIPQ